MTDLEDFSDFDGGVDDAAEVDGGAEPGDRTQTEAGVRPGSESTDREQSFDRLPTEPRPLGDAIGTVSVASGLRVAEEEDDTSLRAYITANNRSDVRLGTYLLAAYPDDERLFCRVAALEYAQEFHADDATEIQARRALANDDFEEADYKFLAELDPVAVLYRESGELARRMVDRVPKPETSVRRATDQTEIKTGLDIPEDGVFFGHLSVGGEKVRTAAEPPTIDYRLKDDYDVGDPLIFRHVLIAGGTGSGKTHAAKNILRQFLGDDHTYPMADGRTVRPAVVQFDPQDEYAQMHDDNPDATRDDERRWEREGIAYGGHDDTVAFIPRVGKATYAADHHRAEQVEFTIPFSMVRSNPWLVAGSGLNENQYPALTNELIPRFFRQFGDRGTYREFRSFLDDPALKEELHESGRVHEATFDAITRRVQGFSSVFDQDARPITELVSEFVRPGRLSVVPTYHINSSRATEVVVLALSSLLVDQKLSNDPMYDEIKETPLIVGMDEAHNFLTDADTVQARHVIGKFTDAAKQGRKERLGLFLITQDPQDIDDAVFKQINTTAVLNLGDEDAIKSVNVPSSLENKIPYMETGGMVVHSPDNSEPVELQGLPTCLTRHGRD